MAQLCVVVLLRNVFGETVGCEAAIGAQGAPCEAVNLLDVHP